MKPLNGLALGLSLFALLAAAGCRARSKDAEPDWVKRGSYREGDVSYAVGIGMTRADALANGLAELSKFAHSEVDLGKKPKDPSAAAVLKSSSKAVFGKVVVTSLLKDETPADGSSQGVTMVETVEMTSGNKSFLINVSMASRTAPDATKSDDRTSIEIKNTNMYLPDLIDELRRAGVRLESYEDKDGWVNLLLVYAPKKA